MESNIFPQDFIDQIQTLLGNEAHDFFHKIKDNPTTSLRIHPEKSYTNAYIGSHIPWTKNGHYLDERPKFTYDPSFHGGAYYVQDASSMFLEHVIKHLIPSPNENTKLLDLCAAPGGKTTILLSHLNGKGIVVANEVIHGRARILEENIIKWGYSNYILTQSDSSYFVSEKARFDLVLVDAPCSGEGLFRKDPNAINSWSIKHVNHCALRQQRILDNATQLVSDQGYLIYSTCTYNQDENEKQIQRLVETREWESIHIPYDENWGIAKNGKSIYAYHFYPHKVKGEGFFISVLKRKNSSQQTIKNKKSKNTFQGITASEFQCISKYVSDKNPDHYFKNKHGLIYYFPYAKHENGLPELRFLSRGTMIGEVIKNKLKPAHALSQSLLYSNKAPMIEVDLEEAILYLKGQTPTLPIQDSDWVIISYKSLPLGWVKIINKNRYNNYYPKQMRIRK